MNPLGDQLGLALTVIGMQDVGHRPPGLPLPGRTPLAKAGVRPVVARTAVIRRLEPGPEVGFTAGVSVGLGDGLDDGLDDELRPGRPEQRDLFADGGPVGRQLPEMSGEQALGQRGEQHRLKGRRWLPGHPGNPCARGDPNIGEPVNPPQVTLEGRAAGLTEQALQSCEQPQILAQPILRRRRPEARRHLGQPIGIGKTPPGTGQTQGIKHLLQPIGKGEAFTDRMLLQPLRHGLIEGLERCQRARQVVEHRGRRHRRPLSQPLLEWADGRRRPGFADPPHPLSQRHLQRRHHRPTGHDDRQGRGANIASVVDPIGELISRRKPECRRPRPARREALRRWQCGPGRRRANSHGAKILCGLSRHKAGRIELW